MLPINQYFLGVYNEAKVELKAYFQNKTAVASDFCSYFFLYIFFNLFQTGTSLPTVYALSQDYASLLLFIGYILWMLCSRALTSISSEILAEANKGFLFAKLTSVFPIQLLYFGKLLASVLIMMLFIVPIFLIMALFFGCPPLAGIQIGRIVLVSLVNLCGMYGIGLLLASLTMANKRLSRISVLLSTILLFTSNALTYNPQMNDVLAYFPANYCIHYARMIISNDAFFPGNFGVMALICVCCLAVGICTFQFSIKKAKQAGNILWY